MDHFPTWDAMLTSMMGRPDEVMVVSVRRKAPRQGSWAKNQLMQKSQNVNRTDVLPGDVEASTKTDVANPHLKEVS